MSSLATHDRSTDTQAGTTDTSWSAPAWPPAQPATTGQAGLTDDQAALDAQVATDAGMGSAEVATLSAFGMRPSEFDTDAARRVSIGLKRLEAMLACENGNEVGCELAGPGGGALSLVGHKTGDAVSGETSDELVVEDTEFTLRLTTTTNSDGQVERRLMYADGDGSFHSGVSTKPIEAIPTEEPEEQAPTSEEGIGSFLEGALLGDFADNDTWSAMAGQTVGDPTACEAMGPGPVRYTTDEGANASQQTVVIEEADYRLTAWSETDPNTGQEIRHLLYEDVDGTYMSGISNVPAETATAPEATQEPEQAPEPESEEGLDSFLEGAVLGDFSDNSSWSALAGQVGIGFVPYAGQAADARDLVAAGIDLYNGKEGAGWRLALSAIAVIPGVGDVLKAVGKGVLGGMGVLGTALIKHSDEIEHGAEAVAKHGEAVAELTEDTAARLSKGLGPDLFAQLSAKLGPDGLAALARGMDADTLARVAGKVDADTLATLVGKGLDGHAIRELADGMGAAELKALAETGTADELLASAEKLTEDRLKSAAQDLRDEHIGAHKPPPKGGNAAAAELTLDDGRRLESEATSKARPMDTPYARSEGADPVSGRGGHYEPTTHADQDWIREDDSEYKILSDLTDQIQDLGIESPTGKVEIYTERAPCDSCLRIIDEFQARFRGIDIRIFNDYTVDGAPL